MAGELSIGSINLVDLLDQLPLSLLKPTHQTPVASLLFLELGLSVLAFCAKPLDLDFHAAYRPLFLIPQ